MFWKLTWANGEVIAMPGVSRSLSLTTTGSSTNALFEPVSGVVVEVTQSGGAPCALLATQFAGRAGANTLSKFSANVPRHGAGVDVGVAVGVGVVAGVVVGVTVGAGVGVGEAVGVGVGVAGTTVNVKSLPVLPT